MAPGPNGKSRPNSRAHLGAEVVAIGMAHHAARRIFHSTRRSPRRRVSAVADVTMPAAGPADAAAVMNRAKVAPLAQWQRVEQPVETRQVVLKYASVSRLGLATEPASMVAPITIGASSSPRPSR